MGVSIEGSEAVWPGEKSDPVLPEFDNFNRQSRYIDIFNKGKGSLDFSATSDYPWILLNKTKGIFGFDERVWVTVDWDKVPKGKSNGSVKIKGTENVITVIVNTFNPSRLLRSHSGDSLKEKDMSQSKLNTSPRYQMQVPAGGSGLKITDILYRQ